MNIIELIKLLLYGSLLNYVTALYRHKENVFDKSKISNEQINRPQTIRIRRSKITETAKEVTIKDTAFRECTSAHDRPAVDFRLSDSIIPQEYKIELTLNTEEDIFYGECNISIIIHRTIRKMSLHSANLEITKFMLSKIIDKYKRAYVGGNIICYIHEQQMVVLDFFNALSPGKYILRITYKGVIANDIGGFIKISYRNAAGDKKWLITTNNSATGMRRLFPCWDEPGLKAIFNIAIRHDQRYYVLSNTDVVYISTSEISSMRMSYFAKTPKIPTYRIAILLFDKNDYIHISPRKPIENLKLERKWTNAQWNKILIDIVTNIVESKWQQPRESLLKHQYAVAGLTDDGVDKLHFVLYRKRDITYNKEIDPVARKIELSRIIGRKIVGQLFGTAVSPSWWSYMWLNEGIATLFGVYIINQTIGSRTLDLFVVQSQQESLRLDDSQIMKPLGSEINSISEINSLFSFAYYIKAPFILRMLHHTVGDEIFQKGINVYMKRETGSLDDFWTVMQSVYDSQTMDLEKLSVKDLMNPWIQEKQYPILNVTEIFDTEWTKIVLETTSKNWTVSLTNQAYINLKRILPKFSLAREQKHFLAKCYNSEYNQFIIINRQQTGYYRVFYNRESWLRIIDYLNSENYTNINVLNRAQLIDDTFHLTISGELDSSVFWEVINYLKWETNYIAWYPMFKVIEHESHTLLFPNVNTTNFKMRLRKLLIPLLVNIGYEEKFNDDNLLKCLRQEALRWACVLGDSECKKYAEYKLQWHLSNPTENKLLPWWREWTFCNGLSVSSISLDQLFNDWDAMLKIKNLNVFKVVACYHDIYSLVSLLKTFKNYHISAYTEDNARTITIIKYNIDLFYYVIQRHANGLMNNILLNNLEEIKPKEMSTTAALITIINYTYSSKLLCEMQKWIHKTLANSLLQNTEHKIKMRLKKHYVDIIDDECKIILL